MTKTQIPELLDELRSQETYIRNDAIKRIIKEKINDEQIVVALKDIIENDSSTSVRNFARGALEVFGIEHSAMEESTIESHNEEVQVKPLKTEYIDEPVLEKNRMSPSVILTGLFAGIMGAIIGAIPIQLLKYFLDNLLVSIYGSYGAIPVSLEFLVWGIPLPFVLAWICVPIGGALFGIVGVTIAFNRNSTRVWLWGGIAGFLSNLLVGFMSQ